MVLVVLVMFVVGAEELLVELWLAEVLELVVEQAAIPRAKRTRTETVDRDLTSTDRRAYRWGMPGTNAKCPLPVGCAKSLRLSRIPAKGVVALHAFGF